MLAVDPQIHFDEREHRYWLIGSSTQRRELLSVTRVLKAVGYVNDAYYLDAHATRGSAAHDATLLVDQHPGDWERRALLHVIGGLAESYAKFLRDHRVRWRMSEQIVSDPILGVAGRLDRLGDIDDDIKDALVDFKSGGDDPAYGVQTAAYERMAPKSMPFVRKRFVLLLQQSGERARLVPKTNRSDYDAFLAAVHTYHWRQQHGRLR